MASGDERVGDEERLLRRIEGTEEIGERAPFDRTEVREQGDETVALSRRESGACEKVDGLSSILSRAVRLQERSGEIEGGGIDRSLGAGESLGGGESHFRSARGITAEGFQCGVEALGPGRGEGGERGREGPGTGSGGEGAFENGSPFLLKWDAGRKGDQFETKAQMRLVL